MLHTLHPKAIQIRVIRAIFATKRRVILPAQRIFSGYCHAMRIVIRMRRYPDWVDFAIPIRKVNITELSTIEFVSLGLWDRVRVRSRGSVK